MKFVKYQAVGNDFIITDHAGVTPENAQILCDRHYGIGADGVLVHYQTPKADAGMKIINSDGSAAEMCGNGLRCFAVYLINDCGFSKNPLNIETGRGVLAVKWEKNEGAEISVEADLGLPEVMKDLKDDEFAGVKLQTVSISMGNPHHVVFTQTECSPDKVYAIANHFQRNNSSGIEMNVEVVTDLNVKNKSVFIVVRERGAGFTLGCGTGGAAVIHALKLKGIVYDGLWTVFFPGGEAKYKIERSGTITVSGTPEKIFSGTFEKGLFNG